MRLIKYFLCILIILVLQSAVLPRLNIFGAIPDLLLVSVVVMAILQTDLQSAFFAAISGFFQDILSFGLYLNTITKIIVSKTISISKENLIDDPYFLALGFVAVLTPLIWGIEGAVFYFLFGRKIVLLPFVFRIIVATLYNLILVPVVFPVLRWLCHE